MAEEILTDFFVSDGRKMLPSRLITTFDQSKFRRKLYRRSSLLIPHSSLKNRFVARRKIGLFRLPRTVFAAALIFEKSLWTNYAIQVNLRGIWEIIVDKRTYLK